LIVKNYFDSAHLVFPEKFRSSCNVEVGVDASHRPVDGVGDDERADDRQIELVIANHTLNTKSQFNVMQFFVFVNPLPSSVYKYCSYKNIDPSPKAVTSFKDYYLPKMIPKVSAKHLRLHPRNWPDTR